MFTRSHTLTFDGGGEAESIKAAEKAVLLSVAPHTWSQVHAPAAVTWLRDGILHRAIRQPASIAPVQPLLPRREKLLKRGQSGVLVLAHLLGPKEVKMVAPSVGVVGKDHTWGGKKNPCL